MPQWPEVSLTADSGPPEKLEPTATHAVAEAQETAEYAPPARGLGCCTCVKPGSAPTGDASTTATPATSRAAVRTRTARDLRGMATPSKVAKAS